MAAITAKAKRERRASSSCSMPLQHCQCQRGREPRRKQPSNNKMTIMTVTQIVAQIRRGRCGASLGSILTVLGGEKPNLMRWYIDVHRCICAGTSMYMRVPCTTKHDALVHRCICANLHLRERHYNTFAHKHCYFVHRTLPSLSGTACQLS